MSARECIWDAIIQWIIVVEYGAYAVLKNLTYREMGIKVLQERLLWGCFAIVIVAALGLSVIKRMNEARNNMLLKFYMVQMTTMALAQYIMTKLY